MADDARQPKTPPRPVREVALVALKLGATAFGGPAAHVAMLREEIVTRRRWMSDAHFLDLLGAVNLIPGPNSTEMVIHAGYERAGWRGWLVAGALFILPAALITLVFAWLYVRYGSTPEVEWLMTGIKPVVIAIVAQAIWGLSTTAFGSGNRWLIVLGVVALALALLGVDELVLIFGAGGLVALLRGARSFGSPLALLPFGGLSPLTEPALAGLVAATGLPPGADPYRAARLFWIFLKIGATLYGGGYVLLAYLRDDLVTGTGWLTESQLLDAVAVGQFTPGPLFTTATFIGYLIGGWWGAILATLGIFLPAFLLVAATNPIVAKLRQWRLTAGFLDGVNAAAIALLALVVWELGREAIVDWLTALLALVTTVLLLRFKINSAWLVLAGAAIGYLAHAG